MLHGVDTGGGGDRFDARDRRIRRVIGADFSGFLSRQGMLDAVGGRTDARCACFDGVYPTDVPLSNRQVGDGRR